MVKCQISTYEFSLVLAAISSAFQAITWIDPRPPPPIPRPFPTRTAAVPPPGNTVTANAARVKDQAASHCHPALRASDSTDHADTSTDAALLTRSATYGASPSSAFLAAAAPSVSPYAGLRAGSRQAEQEECWLRFLAVVQPISLVLFQRLRGFRGKHPVQ